MDDFEIERVAKVLAEWNPLSTRAGEIADLDDYRIEVVDIMRCHV